MNQKRPHTTQVAQAPGHEAGTRQTHRRSVSPPVSKGKPQGRTSRQKAHRQPAKTSVPTPMKDMDLVLAGVLAVLAAGAAFALPEGNVARMLFTLSVLLVVPGYVLIQVVVGRIRSTSKRLVHLLLSLGLSPAIVGLLALATAIIPGGFQAPLIIAFVTVWSVALAGLAYWRRRVYTDPVPDAQATPATF